MTEDHRTRTGQQRRQKMRMRLLESALGVFAEKGVDVSVIDDVIARAGVSRGTFYNYYRTNSEILTDVGQELSNEIVHMIEQVVGNYDNPVERLATGLRKFMMTCIEYPILARFVWRAGFNAYSANNLILVYLPRHIEDAMTQRLVKVHDSLFALEFIAGVMLSSSFAVSTRSVAEHYPRVVIQHILLGLGVPEEQACTLADLPMPDFPWPEDSFLTRAQSHFDEVGCD